MVATPTAIQTDAYTSTAYQIGERRRSHRVTLSPSLAAHVPNLGSVELIELGLGGAVVETYVRPETDQLKLQLGYGGQRVELNASLYQLNVHELFYSDDVGSKVRYRARMLFDDPSVSALNLLYRIIGANWHESGFPDDTVPVS